MIDEPWTILGWLLVVTIGPVLVISATAFVAAVIGAIINLARKTPNTKPERHLKAVD